MATAFVQNLHVSEGYDKPNVKAAAGGETVPIKSLGQRTKLFLFNHLMNEVHFACSSPLSTRKAPSASDCSSSSPG